MFRHQSPPGVKFIDEFDPFLFLHADQPLARSACGAFDPDPDSLPLSDVVIYGHLAGEHTVGVYPLLEDDSCYFLAVDFDDAEWREDARAFMQACEALGVPAALEISRSGSGANNAGKSSALQALHFAVAVAQTARLVGDGVNWAKGKFQVSFNPTQLLYSPVPDVLSLAHGGQLQEPQESVNWSVFGRRQHSVHRGSYERSLSCLQFKLKNGLI